MATGIHRRKFFGAAGVVTVGAAIAACSSNDGGTAASSNSGGPAAPTTTSFTPRPPITTPQAALEELRQGNERYLRSEMNNPGADHEARVHVAEQQEPFAVILSCADSRVPPEILLDQGFGDLFVVRVAGNIVGRSELGSIQYAVEHLHTPLIATVGHAACGAVGAAVDVADGGSRPGGAIDDIVDHILPAVQKAKTEPGDDLLTKAIQVNARQSRDQLLADPLIAGMVKEDKLKVIAAYYALDNGRFVVLD